MGVEAKERNIYKKPELFDRYTEFGGEPALHAEDNLRAGFIVIEAWFGGY